MSKPNQQAAPVRNTARSCLERIETRIRFISYPFYDVNSHSIQERAIGLPNVYEVENCFEELSDKYKTLGLNDFDVLEVQQAATAHNTVILKIRLKKHAAAHCQSFMVDFDACRRLN